MAIRIETTAKTTHSQTVLSSNSSKIMLAAIIFILGTVIPNLARSVAITRSSTLQEQSMLDQPQLISPTTRTLELSNVPSTTDATAKTVAATTTITSTAAAAAEITPVGIISTTEAPKLSEPPPAAATKKEKKTKPLNVLVLYPDDWRHDTIGKENSMIHTPFLDSLADQGIRFRQNAVTSSICWVSRATLFTGQWPSRHQSKKLICPHFAAGYRWKESSWPGMLQKNGYFVGHVGKWQYYSDNTGRFDFHKPHEGQHWYPGKDGKMVAADDLARDDAIEFLQTRPKDKPFAMTVAFYPPKPVGVSEEPGAQFMPKNSTRALYENITVPELYNMSHARSLMPLFLQWERTAAVQRFKQRYGTQERYQESMKNMYALITQVDQACKEIVDEIKKQGLLDETMIIFTTDNGMFNGAHGLAGKWYPYQESIRVPLIIHDPRMPESKRGTLNDDFTLNVDLAETILGAAGVQPHPDMQGRDIADLYLEDRKAIRKERPWREEFFYDFDVEEGRHIPGNRALVRKKFKYLSWYGWNIEQLFDLEEDPFEFTDVKDRPENAKIMEEMRARMAVLKVEADGGPNPEVKDCTRKSGEEHFKLYSMEAVRPQTDASEVNVTQATM